MNNNKHFPKKNNSHEENSRRNYNKGKNNKNAGKFYNGNKLHAQEPMWYADSPDTIRNIGSFPWNTILGNKIYGDDTVPGFMQIPYIPAISEYEAKVGTKTYSLTRTAQQYFEQINQGVSGGYTEFDAPDVFMLSIAAADCCSTFAHLKRIYGILSEYSGNNAFAPDAWLVGLGVDPSSLKDGTYTKTDFVSDFNLRVDQFNEIVVIPKEFKISARWNFMNSYLFSDNSKYDMSTIMAYVPAGMLLYDGFTATTGTQLRYVDYEHEIRTKTDVTFESITGRVITPVSIQKWWERLDTQLKSLSGFDQRYMFQAVKKIFNDGDILQISYLDPTFESMPVSNDIVRIAIHNSMMIPWVYPGFFGSQEEIVETDPFNPYPNSIKYSYRWMWQDGEGEVKTYIGGNLFPAVVGLNPARTELYSENHKYLLDSFDTALDAGMTLDATANICIIDDRSYVTVDAGLSEKIAMHILKPRADVCLSPVLVYIDSDNYVMEPVSCFIQHTDTYGGFQFDDIYSMFTHINSHPFIYDFGNGEDLGADYNLHSPTRVIGEIDEYTLINRDSLDLTNQKCIYYMLKLPKASKSFTR